MDRKRLKYLLLKGREEFGQYWEENWKKIHGIYRGLFDRIINGEDPRKWSNEDYGDPELKNKHKDIEKLFWYVFGVAGAEKLRDEDVEKFREFLSEMSGASSEQDATEILKRYENEITGLKIISLAVWASIIHPKWFAPLWGSSQGGPKGVINRCSAQILDIDTIQSFDQYNEVLTKIKEVAKEVGIDNMLEVAFYLIKCDEIPLPPPNNPNNSIPKELKEKLENLLNNKKQVILYGPPGTGKTWIARNYVRLKTNNNKKFYRFVTFHPSYCYEEFVEGIRPETVNGSISYKVKDGIFKEICKEAYNKLLEVAGINKRWENDLPELEEDEKERVKTVLDSENCPKFYLVIDEINRGDISRIFGELITLLEADKRLFAENEITVTLPYSKEPFGVPPNLFIIGTMNTADRSIALIDIALRRRFGFIELMPDYNILEEKLLGENVSNDIREIRELAIKVLKSINEKIRKLYDRDHQIGHSYFLKLKDCETRDKTIETLKYIWFHEVIPLLQEYFYDSPKKLKEVLSDKFVIVDENEITYEFKQMEDFSDDDFLNALRELAQRGE